MTKKKTPKKKLKKARSCAKQTRSKANTGVPKWGSVSVADQEKIFKWHTSTQEMLGGLGTKEAIYLFYALVATLGDMTTPPNSPDLFKKLKRLKTLNTSIPTNRNRE